MYLKDNGRAIDNKQVVDVWHLDMASYLSVLIVAACADKERDRLHIALFNACRPANSSLLSTFFLVLALLPKLTETSAKFRI